jgi:hypothetical protein
MIAILHKEGIVHMFIPDVVSINNGDVIGLNASAKGTIADILVVDVYEYREGIIPAVYEDVDLIELDEKGEPRTMSIMISPEIRETYIVVNDQHLKVGDAIEVSNFTDTRDYLPQTQEKIDRDRLDALELVMADLIMGGI